MRVQVSAASADAATRSEVEAALAQAGFPPGAGGALVVLLTPAWLAEAAHLQPAVAASDARVIVLQPAPVAWAPPGLGRAPHVAGVDEVVGLLRVPPAENRSEPRRLRFSRETLRALALTLGVLVLVGGSGAAWFAWPHPVTSLEGSLTGFSFKGNRMGVDELAPGVIVTLLTDGRPRVKYSDCFTDPPTVEAWPLPHGRIRAGEFEGEPTHAEHHTRPDVATLGTCADAMRRVGTDNDLFLVTDTIVVYGVGRPKVLAWRGVKAGIDP